LGNEKEFKNPELEEFAREALVDIQGWGGDRFPAYYYNYGQNASRMDGWIRYADTKPWPDTEWSFSYWALDKYLNFYSKSVLREEFNPRDTLEKKLSLEWLLLDVARPLMFARNMMNLTGIKNWKIWLKYKGIKGRELVILSSRRAGFHTSYVSHENEFVREYVIDDSSNLEDLAFTFCFEMLGLFNWRTPNQEVITKDLHQLFEGHFPR